MDKAVLTQQLNEKMDNSGYLSREACSNLSLLPSILEGIRSPETSIKYKCLKILNLISSKNPAHLYPHFAVFSQLLDSSQNIFRWNAIDIVANLVAVDSDNKFTHLFPHFYGLLKEGSLITAAHVVESSPVIVKHRPRWEPLISKELLTVETINLPTEECRNILRGKVILAFTKYFKQSGLQNELLEFARAQTNNPHPATRKKAEQFIKRFA